MKFGFRKIIAMLIGVAGLCATVSAQDLLITNARILDGAGGAIGNGSVVVRDGRIDNVVAGRARAPSGARTINARGRTVMPGYIDAHRHIVAGDGQTWLAGVAEAQMQEFLEAGFTTVLSAIDPPELLEVRDRIAAGEMTGPRLFAGAFIPLAGPSGPPMPPGDPARFDTSRLEKTGPAAPAIPRDQTIAAVARIADAGYDYIKNVIVTTPGGPEVETLKLIIAEGKRRGVPTITHAVSVVDTLAAVEAGPAVLVHTPHIGHLQDFPHAIETIVGAGIPMTSTLAIFTPHFDENNEPLFRDGGPFPWETLTSAGDGPVNARLLWEAGITYAYGTDTSWPPKQSLSDELRALRLVFSPKDIVTILTQNAAKAVLHGDELGTLEPGKFADIVIIDGDPLATSEALLNVVTTIKGGRVVFER
ncbi:MAG: amidohydrolase family protein [Gammaproteobacteria bacterium]|jgi:imidazolonepropionase-like amidohydrolase